MLTILNDPSGVTGAKRHEFDCSISLQENIERHLDAGGDCEVRIDGILVDPLTDPRMDRPPAPDDVVTIARRPAYGSEWAVYAAWASLALSVYSYATRPRPDGPQGGGNDSPNNSLTAQTNIARAYQGIPDVYGYRRVWPDLIQPSTVEYIDNLKYVTEWLCIGRGKGDISSVQYAESPIGDIEGSSYEVFEPVPVDGYPEFGTTTIHDVYEAFASDEVNGQELPYSVAFPVLSRPSALLVAVTGATTFTLKFADGPDVAHLKGLVPSGTADVSFTDGMGNLFGETCTVLSFVVMGSDVQFTFSSLPWAYDQNVTVSALIDPQGQTMTTIGPFTLPVDADQIWWNTVFLRGLRGAVDSVQVLAEWWQVDSFGVEVPGTRQTQTNVYAANTFDQLYYTNKVTPSGGHGRYRIQFTRTVGPVDEQGADVARLEEVYAVRYYAHKVLPGVTVLRVTTKATLSATGFSDRKFNLRWGRHVRGLYSDTLSHSRNYARIMAHIWTIAHNDIAGLDVDALQEINDQFGEYSSLLRFDGSLDDANMSLGERMQFVAGTVRCELWRDGTRWTVTRDQARASHEMQFDYRNLAAGAESSINYASHLPASNDGVEVEYVDEATQSKKAYVRLSIESGEPVVGEALNPLKVRMQGCATQAQAENRAYLEARRLLFVRETVTDTALGDAMSLGKGALVRWVDPNDFGGDGLQAGEVMSIIGNRIGVSEPLNWSGATQGRIQFTLADGRNAGSAVRCTRVDDLTLDLEATPSSGIYVAGGDRQCGSRFAFAVGLTSDELAHAGLYTVKELRPDGAGRVSIAFEIYDARVYEGD